MKIIIILLVVGLLLWLAWSYFASNVEQLKYTVLENKGEYEIRQYEDYIAAEVEVNKTGMEALNSGFVILANYIFGGNIGSQKVAMTAPVLAQEKGEKVAMTAPVLTQENNGTTTVVFSMPSKYTLDTLPKTTDSRITFKEVQGRKMAAYKFSWYYTTDRISEKKKYFQELLAKEGYVTVGEPIFAGYSGPGTIPFLIRNEILVEIE